ncbi:MAG: hydrogenase expression/formation protein HypE [Desulfobacterota bacterium]|jgi:hydrogenase expression/formation protein HypE|nr:hydrogenase expression/formation protein HypE [Thermodesulfobacteriota bacterium]
MSDEKILLAHGSGGKLSHDLVSEILVPRFSNPFLEPLDDSARITNQEGPLAFTTDSYVINPLFFPGGDIGRLAVCGTVNDLSMIGAVPSHLSLALIIEEGFSFDRLKRIMSSVREAAEEASVRIVTGDTKVVEHGAADQIFINTAGIGWIPRGVLLSGRNAKPGDRVILSGFLGDHEIAVLSQREGFGFEGDLKSDCAPLNGLVAKMLEVCPSIRCLRDPTRGGLATTLNEIASASGVGIVLEEARIPVRESVRGTCELLGLDPLYLANEGKLIAICPPQDAEKVLETMRAHPLAKDGEIIGQVTEENPRRVTLRTLIGGRRILDMLTGAQYPRIC